MIERTTVSAQSADLAVLREEARRRGISLAALLRHAVAREASELRSARRPRVGIGSSRRGAAFAAALDPDEPYEREGPGR